MEDLRLFLKALQDHPFLVPLMILVAAYIGHCVGSDIGRRIRKFQRRKIDKAIKDYEGDGPQ